MRRGILIIALVAACDPTSGRSVRPDDELISEGGPAGDDGGADATVPERCAIPGDTRCEGEDVLMTCGPGATMESTTCALGCSPTPVARCRVFAPSGPVTSGDATAAGLASITFATGTTINGATGEIVGVRAAGEGVANGIGFRVAQRTSAGGVSYAVGIFSFESLMIASGVELALRGANSVALVAGKHVQIDGVIDARGDCAGVSGGPGGFAGGAANTAGLGPGGGQVASGVGTTDPGGGGGGYAAPGGRGGPTATGIYSVAGVVYGDAELTDLLGGSGGADGFNGGVNGGGGGGGAVQIVSLRDVTIGGGPSVGGINAGGCGGFASAGSGGGGGSGGAIVVEAPRIILAGNGVLAANGGGGGGAEVTAAVRQHGALGASPAPAAGSGGGAGGAGASPAGKDGSKPGGAAGGGGGGCGRIKLRAFDPIDLRGVVSPAIGSGATAKSEGG
ncbi:MAG: hypothetical protein KF819_01830 [Labilithrix sp.]|nr:hypothetical protein [Labilithrix sp.]